MKNKIAPSILSADFGNFARDVKRLESAGADLVHIDVMDGHFVDNLTFGAGVVSALRAQTHLFFDVHMMVENPEKYVEDFAKAGADKKLDFEIEVDGGIDDQTIKVAKAAGANVFVAGSFIFNGEVEKNIEKLRVNL